jgi:uncharacterized membrane protein YphA (DoxX/SURF4 family)
MSLLLLVACLVPAVGKLTSHQKMQASAARFGIPWPRYRLIGIAELAAAAGVLAGLVARSVGVAAATGMLVLLVGALGAHRRAGDPAKAATPAFVALGVTCAYLAVALGY